MARKLKTFETSLGFFDLAIAAPSMKAALEAWGADSNLFHQGVARESTDPDVVAATLAKPGVILKRPVGSSGPFREEAELPASLARGDSGLPGKGASSKAGKGRPKTGKPPPRATDDKAARKAALAFEREQTRRERARQKEEAAREEARERREQAVARAQAALDAAEREHDKRVAAIDAEREALEAKAQAEETRWMKQRAALQQALRLARE
ncbi:cell envelope biogenesis protein TolA [Bradyrhizobium sp. STM 3557]|uniref:cell envelope biogenesis protein TolA n=1 Tax=Bradyrhizobium sp. STM 3557 TaxID=578920 RepID=UPI003890A0AB